MKNKKGYLFFRLLLSLISGFLFIFAFPPYNIWQIAFFSLVPLIAIGEENDGKNFVYGLIGGFVFYSASFFWLVRVAGPVYLLLALYLSIYWGIFLYLVFALPEKGRIFTAGFLWVLIEIIISHLLTGFPWLLAGLSQWNNPYLLKVASFTGIYGLSFLVITGNFTVFYSFRKKHFLSWCISLLIFIGVIFSTPSTSSINVNEKLNVLIVQPNIDSTESQNPLQNISKIKDITSEYLKRSRADIVIWPESTYPEIVSPDIIDDLKNFAAEYNTYIILGTFTGSEDEMYNSAVMIGKDSVQIYNKTHLVPYGEFIPGGRLKIISSLFEKLAGYTPYVKRGKEPGFFFLQDKKIGILICFENIFPEIASKVVKGGAEVLVVITNDSWFGNSAGPYQHFAHNTIRAVETGRYFIQSSLSGISGIISPDGSVITIKDNGKEIFVEGIISYSVPLLKEKTYYSIAGDLPLFILSVIFTGAILCRKKV